MKKFLTLAAVALVASAAQAGSLKWTATNVFAGDENTKADGIAYFLSTDMYSVAEMQTLLDGGTVEKTVGSETKTYDLESALEGKYSYTPTTEGTYSIATGVSTDTLGVPGSSSVTVYLVIFDGETIADSSAGFVSSTKQVTTPGATSSNTAQVSFGTQKTASQNSENWKTGFAVPEPASALLMLVGAGLLAIRRKRA